MAGGGGPSGVRVPRRRSRNLELGSLEATIKSTDESAILIPPWLLRSVMVADTQAGGTTLLILRGKSHGIRRDRLEAIIEQRDLPLYLERTGGSVLLLLARPDEDWLVATEDAAVLREYWRLLFHARAYITIKQRLEAAGWQGAVQVRIERIGRSTFNDARFVLQRERLVAPTADDLEVYSRFAATFLEMTFFSPDLLPRFFATVTEPRQILEAIIADLDADALLRRTRPVGVAIAREPAVLGASQAPVQEDLGADPHLGGLAARMAKVLGHGNAAEWAAGLAPIVARAAQGRRSAERGLLHELQKACEDSERDVYALDTPGWLLTFGRRPLRRAVPAQQMMLVCKHLRSAWSHLNRCRLEPARRERIENLLRAAVSRAEGRLRDRFRPFVSEALDRAGLRPHHRVEQVARQKVIEEFTDGIVQRGFARMGDLRDAISRNQLKMEDLAGVSALLWGDQLLRIDRHLSGPLDGVYHPGEAYLRLFQRMSSLLFATPLGRVFTYYCLIPFGGAFVLQEILDRTIGRLSGRLARALDPFEHPVDLLLPALFLMAVVNVPGFRRGLAWSIKAMVKVLRRVFVDWPGWLLCRRFIQAIAASRVWRAFWRYGLKPLAVTWMAWRMLPRGIAPAVGAPILVGIYIAAAAVLNWRGFRAVAHALAHYTVVVWGRLIGDVLAGLFRAIVRAFGLLLERLERMLYAVDEWLRLRGGQGRGALVVKAILGCVWGLVAYCVRFFVNLLAEPQINPIKHFPVVTVSHKLILPAVPFMARGLRSLGLGEVQATTYATTTAFLIPGVFGFLAWELKENWKLYSANRSPILRPVRMGSRGETFSQLLRPGFHSGTVPKIFARMRRAAMQEDGREETTLRKHEESLGQVQEAVRHFLRRELAGLLNQHPAWRATPVGVGPVDLAATRIRAALECPSRGTPACLGFEQHDGWIVAGIHEPGWMAGTSGHEAAMLGVALLGFYQTAGVDLVAEQIERLFAPLPIHWMIRHTDLVVWTGPHFDVQARYSLKQEAPPGIDGEQAAASDLPQYAVPDLLLRRRPVAWRDWARFWDAPGGQWDACLRRLAEEGASVLPVTGR